MAAGGGSSVIERLRVILSLVDGVTGPLGKVRGAVQAMQKPVFEFTRQFRQATNNIRAGFIGGIAAVGGFWAALSPALDFEGVLNRLPAGLRDLEGPAKRLNATFGGGLKDNLGILVSLRREFGLTGDALEGAAGAAVQLAQRFPGQKQEDITRAMGNLMQRYHLSVGEAADRVAILSERGFDLQGSVVDAMNRSANAAGAFQRVMKGFNDSPAQKLARLRGAAENLAVSFGQNMLKAIAPFIDWLREGVVRIQSWIDRFPGLTRLLGFAAAAVLSLVAVFSVLMGVLAALQIVLILTNPFVWMAIALVAIIAALALVIIKADAFAAAIRSIMGDLWDWIVKSGTAAIELVLAPFRTLIDMVQRFLANPANADFSVGAELSGIGMPAAPPPGQVVPGAGQAIQNIANSRSSNATNNFNYITAEKVDEGWLQRQFAWEGSF